MTQEQRAVLAELVEESRPKELFAVMRQLIFERIQHVGETLRVSTGADLSDELADQVLGYLALLNSKHRTYESALEMAFILSGSTAANAQWLALAEGSTPPSANQLSLFSEKVTAPQQLELSLLDPLPAVSFLPSLRSAQEAA